MPTTARATAAIAILSVSCLALTACGSGGGAASDASPAAAAAPASGQALVGQSITVYSGQHEQTTKALADDFQKRTGVKVNLRSGDEAELANQILQEGSASLPTSSTPRTRRP